MSEDRFRREFIARTKEAREASGYTQARIAEFFGVKQDLWKQYETRSQLPTRMIGKFCLLVRCDPWWLLTGEGSPPEPAPQLRPHRAVRLLGRPRRRLAG